MDVILLESINKLGGLGDKVSVKAGFARNFLVPQGKAVFATEAQIKKFEARRAELEKQEAIKLAEAHKRAEAINSLHVTIAAPVSDEGKLYGSVGTAELVEAVAALGPKLCKSEISLPEGVIRFIGEYDINVHLHSDVTAVIHLEVVSDSAG